MARQVNELVRNEDLPFRNDLTVNVLDSNFGHPEYIADTYDRPNLVNVIRLASNRNVWKMLNVEQQAKRRQDNEDPRGARAIFGQAYSLGKAEEWDLPPDRTECFGIKLSNGKNCEVQVAFGKICCCAPNGVRT